MDLKVIESYDGGELVKTDKDLTVIEGLENMPYLSLFGGNVAADTTNKRLETQQDFSWWGNKLFHQNDPEMQFNSQTERALMTTPLTSFGRTQIQDAVKADLRFMRPFAKIGVAVAIIDTDKVLIGIAMIQPDNLERREFIYIWDATRNELNLPSGVNGPIYSENPGSFDYQLDFDFEP